LYSAKRPLPQVLKFRIHFRICSMALQRKSLVRSLCKFLKTNRFGIRGSWGECLHVVACASSAASSHHHRLFQDRVPLGKSVNFRMGDRRQHVPNPRLHFYRLYYCVIFHYAYTSQHNLSFFNFSRPPHRIYSKYSYPASKLNRFDIGSLSFNRGTRQPVLCLSVR
jgi:hypothetical protein